MPRHFLVVFLSFYAEFSLAAANDWNCEKNEAGEWSCVTQVPATKSQAAAAQKTVKSVPQTAVKPASAIKEQNSKPEPLPESSPAAIVAVPTEQPVSAPVLASPVAVKTKKPLKQHESMAIANIQPAQNPVPVPLSPPANSDTHQDQEGWTCAPNQENSTWDCRLVGANPKGEAKIVAEDDHALRLIEPAFDVKQERAFKNLQKEFPFNPWLQCSAPNQPKPKLQPKKGLRKTSPLEIEADYSEVFDKEISNFTGNVDIHRADQHLVADNASYDSAANMMDTQGDVYYSEDSLALFSKTASLKLAVDKAVLRDVLFESLSGPFRGSADVAYKDSKDLSHYKEAAYTSCAPGNQDWVLHTSRLKLNKDSGEGSATNAWLEFKGVPVIYTP